jgi:hypothetical protein
VALELGVGAGTLERWRAEALAAPARQRSWTANGIRLKNAAIRLRSYLNLLINLRHSFCIRSIYFLASLIF